MNISLNVSASNRICHQQGLVSGLLGVSVLPIDLCVSLAEMLSFINTMLPLWKRVSGGVCAILRRGAGALQTLPKNFPGANFLLVSNQSFRHLGEMTRSRVRVKTEPFQANCLDRHP